MLNKTRQDKSTTSAFDLSSPDEDAYGDITNKDQENSVNNCIDAAQDLLQRIKEPGGRRSTSIPSVEDFNTLWELSCAFQKLSFHSAGPSESQNLNSTAHSSTPDYTESVRLRSPRLIRDIIRFIDHLASNCSFENSFSADNISPQSTFFSKLSKPIRTGADLKFACRIADNCPHFLLPRLAVQLTFNRNSATLNNGYLPVKEVHLLSAVGRCVLLHLTSSDLALLTPFAAVRAYLCITSFMHGSPFTDCPPDVFPVIRTMVHLVETLTTLICASVGQSESNITQLKTYFLSALAGLNSLVLSCPTNIHCTNSTSADARFIMSTLSTTSKTLLSASLFPDIAAETLITSLCFLARLQPDALDSWQSYFGDWVVFRPLLLSSTSIGEEVLSTLVFFLYSSCKAGGAENSRLIILVLNDLVRLFTPTEEDCDEKVVHLASVFVSFLTLNGEDSENPNLLSLATGLVPTNIALSFVWTCIISLAGASQLPKEPMWTLANVYVHLYERASTDVWKINPSPLPLSEQLYEQLSVRGDAPASLSLESSCNCLHLLVAVARTRPFVSPFRSALLQCVVEQNLIASATSVPVWHSFQQIRLIFELITAFTSLVTGLSDNKILEDACKVAAVLRDLFSSEKCEPPPIRDKWLRQVPLIMSAFVDCLTRPDPTLCGGFSVGFPPLKRNLISSLVNTTLLLIRCTLELVDRLPQQSVNEDCQLSTGSLPLRPVVLAAWTGLARLLTSRISPATPASCLAYHIHRACLSPVANEPCSLPIPDRGTLRGLCRKHLPMTLQDVLIAGASPTNSLTLDPDHVVFLAALLTVELELTSWDPEASSDKGRLTVKRFIRALPLQDNRTSEEETAVAALFQGLLEISMNGFGESAFSEKDAIPEAAAAIPPDSSLGRRNVRLFVFTLGVLLEYLDCFSIDGEAALEDRALLSLVDVFSTELHAFGRRSPFTDLERQLLSTDSFLQDQLLQVASSAISYLRRFASSQDVSTVFLTLLHALWTRGLNDDPPLLAMSSFQVNSLFQLVLSSESEFRMKLLDLLVKWVKSVDVLEPSRHIRWPLMTPVALPEPTLKPKSSLASLSSSVASTATTTAFYATDPCAVFRFCAAAFTSSSDVRTCLAAATTVSDGNASVLPQVRRQSTTGRIDQPRRLSSSLKVIDGVANSLWPVSLARYLSAYETTPPPAMVAAPQSTSSTVEGPLHGVALSTWFNLNNAQTSLSGPVNRQEFVSALPLTTERILFYSTRGILVHLATLEAVSASAGPGRRFYCKTRLPTSAQSFRSQPALDVNAPSCWSFQFWTVPHLAGVYVRVWRRCARHPRAQQTSSYLFSSATPLSMAESDLHFTLVGDAFLPLTEEEATAAGGGQPTAVGWSHLFLTVLWNPDAVGVLSGWVSCTVNGSAHTEQPLLLHHVSAVSDCEGSGHSSPNQALLRRRPTPASCGDADCLNLWIGQRFTVCEDERQPGAVAHRSGQISLGNIAIFTGPILRHLKPDPHQSQDSHRIEQIRRLALSLALCGPEWCNTVASFDLGDRLLRANTVLRGLLQPHRLRSGDTTNQIHLSEAATKLLTPPSSDLPTVVPWFSLLKAIIKHCLLAMVPSYSLDRVLWFSTCDFTVYEGDKPCLSTHSSAMLYANRPLSSVSNALTVETVLETRPLREGVATALHSTDGAIRSSSQSETIIPRPPPNRKRDLETALGPLGGIQPAFYLLGALICKDNNTSSSSSADTTVAGFDLLLSLIRHSTSAAVQFYRPLASEASGLCARKSTFPVEQQHANNPDADRLILRSHGCHLLASLFSQFTSASLVISDRLAEVLLRHVFQRLQPSTVPISSYLLCDPDLLKCLLFFLPTALMAPSTAAETPTHLMPLLLNRLASSLSDEQAAPEVAQSPGPLRQRLISVNVAILNRFRIIQSVVNSFRINSEAISADNRRLGLTWLESLAQLFASRLHFAAIPELAETLAFLLRTLVAVDPDLYYSAFTRAFGAGLSNPGPTQRQSTPHQANDAPLDHHSTPSTPSNLATLAQTIGSSVVVLLPSRHHSAPGASLGSTPEIHPSAKGNCAGLPKEDLAAVETPFTGPNSPELREVKEEQAVSPVAGPQKPPIVTDWLRLEPALSLKGASKAEKSAIAKFEADLRSATEGETSAAGGLLTYSTNQSSLRPCHLSVCNLFSVSGSADSRHSLISTVCLDDNVLLLRRRRSAPADDSLHHRCRSLPRLDLCVEEDSGDRGSTQPEQSPDSKDTDTPPLRSKPTGPTAINPPVFESPGALPSESDTPLTLKHNRLLSDALLSALEAFWSIPWDDSGRSQFASSELQADEQAQLTVPVWFIYHLAGHPCCRFRECALSLYDVWCGSQASDRHSAAVLDSVGRQMAGQILSLPHSVTLLLQGAALEASDCPFHEADGIAASASASFDAADSSSPSPGARLSSRDLPSVLKHRHLSSPRMIDKAFGLLPLSSSTSVDSTVLSLRLPVALAVIAAATVDTAVLAWLAVTRISDSRLCEALERQLTASLTAIERFAIFAKCFPDILKLLQAAHLFETLVDLAPLLQSICFSICHLRKEGEQFCVRLHEASFRWARLLSAVFNGFDVVTSFPFVQQLISRLTDNSVAFYPDAASGPSACVIHESLLRVHLTLFDGLCSQLVNLPTGAELSDRRQKLLAHLNWTVNGIMRILLPTGVESMPNRFQSASEGPLLKSSNGDDFEVLQVDVKPHDRLPIIDQLERALITALVNVASQALKNEVSDVFNILSGCLLRLLSAWTSTFVDDFSMSEAGRYLIGLLALEPNLLGRTAPNTSLGFLSLLRRNLKILEAVLLLPSSEEYPIGKTSMTQSTAAILDAMPNPQLTVDHSLPVSPTSISTLYDWIDSVTSLQLHSPSPGLDPKYTINGDRPMATLIENLPICDATGGGHQETTEFLDQLRLFYDQGQHQWLATVSQINYILTVVAPYHWTALSESMDHECSVFTGTSQIPTFHQLDAFQSDFRDRRRRRGCFFFMDERFIRKSHRSGLVQHLSKHPLQNLLLPTFFISPLSGGSCHGCKVLPYSQLPPSCQSLFEPSPTIAPDSCLGVWPCRLVEVSAAYPLTGDLTLDVFWLHLCLNVPPEHQKVTDDRRTPSFLHGLNGEKLQSEVFTCPLDAIACVEERRFELRDLAAEIFFHRSFGVPPLLLALRSKSERDHFLHTLAGACQQALKLSGHAADASSSVSWWCPAPPPELGPMSPRSRRQPPPISLHTICDSLVAPFPTPVGNAMRNRLIQAQITWLRGEMCNFDYLMVLNTVAGRTYNDLTQYPIFPWIISDFNSEVLDLSKPSSFRNLHRPVSVQTEARAEKVASHYEELRAQQESLQAADENQRNLIFPIFHYPSFCSNEAITLHFLFRLAPFAFRLIQFQDGNFDAPDRSFHSVATEWQLATSSVACTKELVPEFFVRPDLFANWENFELGSRQNGSPIDCVVLPPWAKGDPRLFTLVNRAAFESAYVTAHLPAWIDLVFGYKQTGRNAERALNLYNPFTYFGAIDVDAIEDPVRRCAVQSMIRNYGQVPRQLFPNHPHPRRTIDPLRDNLTKEVAVSGKAAEFLGFIWLIRLFLSSLLAPAASPLPTEEGLVNCGNWDSSVAVVNPPSEMDDSEERQQELTRGLNVSVVPQTAGAPLDTVIGLAWGKWAGSPATDPLRVVWLTNLQGESLMGKQKRLSTPVWRAFNMTGALWFRLLNGSLTPSAPQLPHVITGSSFRRDDTASCYWIPLITDAFSHACLVRMPEQSKPRSLPTDRPATTTLLVKFSLRDDGRSAVQSSGICVLVRPLHARAVFAASTTKYYSFIRLPFACDEPRNPISAFLVLSEAPTGCQLASEFHVLLGSVDGGLYFRTFLASELLASFVRRRLRPDSDKFHFPFSAAASSSSSDTSTSPPRPRQRKSAAVDRPFCLRLNKRDVVRHATHASSLSSRNWRTLVGHNGAPVLCLAACLAHGLVASGDKNGRIIVWDLASGSFLHVLRSLQPSPKSPVESPRLEPTLESLDTSSSSSSSSSEDGNDNSNPEAELSRFVEVCGLAFNQLTGDLLAARSSVFGRKEIWLGLYTADGHQACSRVLDFSAEFGFLSTTPRRSPSPVAVGTAAVIFQMPMLFSAAMEGAEVDCILIGGTEGCLVWLNSWTLDTISVLRLNQPTPCPITSLLFAPLSGRLAPSTLHPVNARRARQSGPSAETSPEFYRALYVVDALGWLYFLEPTCCPPVTPKATDPTPSPPHKPGTAVSTSLVELPGLWL